ncbi:MAG: sporulation protein YqfD [Bacilli bacterium]|nr:sporulation protein YqfD [Bacilli bacterium]
MSRIKLKITGKNIEYFLNLLFVKNINLDVLSKDRNSMIIVVSSEDYNIIKTIKTTYKIKVLKVYGFLYIKYLLKTYSCFIISFFIFFLIIITISNLILNIDVISNNSSLKKSILEDLKVRGISKYRFKVDYYTKQKIINEILDEENDKIEWMEIEEYGTKYIIKVVERKKNNDIDNCVPSNIVAKRDAIVLDIQASSGEVLTAINKSVKKGDILISGNIFNKEEIVNTKCSIGKVFGEVWYQVYVDVPVHYYEENVTGKVERKIGFDLFNYSTKSSFSTYKRNDINIIYNKLLPVRLYYTEYLETIVTDKTFDLKNVDNYALELATRKINNRLGKDDKILLKKILKKDMKNSRIIVGVFFKVFEDIGVTEEIPAVVNNGE